MDCNYLFGKLNKETIHKDYEGLTTDTAKTIIEEDNIKVDVLKVPNSLTILDENSQIAYDGSSTKILDLRSIRESIPNNGEVEKTTEDESILHIKRDDKELFNIDLGGFIQTQSDLAQESESSDSYVKNKSTKYLKNEGSDGNSTYAETKDLKRWLDLDNEELQDYNTLRLGETLTNPDQMLGVRLYKELNNNEVRVDIGQFSKEINTYINDDNYIGIALHQNKNGKFSYIYNNHNEFTLPDKSGQLALTTDLASYTAGNNISIENNVIDTKNVLRLDTSNSQQMSTDFVSIKKSTGEVAFSPNGWFEVNTTDLRKVGLTVHNTFSAGPAVELYTDKVSGNGVAFCNEGIVALEKGKAARTLNFPDKSGTLATTDDIPKYNGLVLNQMSGNVNGDTVNLTFDKVSLSTGESGTADTYQFGPASETTPGLMTSADVKALSDLQQRVGNLETKTTRLIYTAKTDPTAEEINTFVTGLGYTAPFSGIAVVVDKTYHIWHYYENDGWKDDGMDTVNLFTNETAGAIKGAGEIAGKIYAENDGTGSVYGWDDLNTKVNEKQDKLTAGNNISITNGIIDTKNVVTYTGEYIDDTNIRGIKKDVFAIRYINSNTDNFRFESGYLTLFTDNKLRFFDATNQYKGLFTPDTLRRVVSGTTYDLNFPDKSGTFALTSDIPDVSEPQYIEIDVSNSMSGTLTTEQLNLLKASNQNYIKAKISRIVGETYSIRSAFEMRLIRTRTRTRNGVTTNENVYGETVYEDGSSIIVDTDSGTYNYYYRAIQPSIDYYTTLTISNSDNNGSTTTSGTLSDDDINIILNYKRSVQLEFSDSVYATLRYTISIENSLLYTGIGADRLFYYAAIDTSNKTWTLNSTTTVSALLDSQFKLYNHKWEAVESSYGSFKQRLAYEHSTGSEYQYTMQPLPTSLREWANCGVGAFEETENDITFYAETKPTNDLSFNIKWEIVYRNRDSEV